MALGLRYRSEGLHLGDGMHTINLAVDSPSVLIFDFLIDNADSCDFSISYNQDQANEEVLFATTQQTVEQQHGSVRLEDPGEVGFTRPANPFLHTHSHVCLTRAWQVAIKWSCRPTHGFLSSILGRATPGASLKYTLLLSADELVAQRRLAIAGLQKQVEEMQDMVVSEANLQNSVRTECTKQDAQVQPSHKGKGLAYNRV